MPRMTHLSAVSSCATTLVLPCVSGPDAQPRPAPTLPPHDAVASSPFLDQVSLPGADITRQDCIAYLRSLPDASVDLVATDPAYSGMNQHLKLGKGRIVGKYDEKGEGKWFEEFHDTPENYQAFLAECFRVMKPNSHIFLMLDSYSMLTLGPLIREQFNVKNVVVWDKVNIGMGHYFRRQSEFILFACKGKKPLSKRSIPDVWRIKRIARAEYPTQKPVELFEAMIASSRGATEAEFTVLDPFNGSGSCAVAAQRQGVRFIGCDVSVKSLELTQKRLLAVQAGLPDPAQPKPAFDEALQKRFW